jgi:hypothetical protein
VITFARDFRTLNSRSSPCEDLVTRFALAASLISLPGYLLAVKIFAEMNW